MVILYEKNARIVVMSEFSERVRKEWAMLNAVRHRYLKQPDDIKVYRNIPYREPCEYDTINGWNLLDLYVKSGYRGKIPVIISFHGGSYVYGSKEMYQFYLMSLAQRGFAVVNFNYRLAPEFRFPAALDDANSVIKWIKENACKYNLDLNNVFLVGDSVGAHYTALYSMICTNPKFSELMGIKSYEGFVPRGVGLNCGVYKINWFFYLVSDFISSMEDVLGEEALRTGKADINGKKVALKDFINIHTNFTKDFPPAFIVAGSYDFVKFQVKYIERLFKKYGIRHVAKIYGTKKDREAIHDFHADLNCELSAKCNDDECEFFKSLCI